MLDVVIIPLLTAHLLCVNVASAGPLVAIWLEWKESRGDELAGKTASYLGWASLLALLAGGGLGIAIGGLHWDRDYFVLWFKTMRYKAMWGVSEYAFSLLLAMIYVVWRRSGTGRWRGLRGFLLLLNGTNLLYHFPFLFSIATAVQFSSEEVGPLGAPQFRSWMMRPDVLARVVHVVLASFAVTGMLLIARALRLSREEEVEDADRLARWGAWLAFVPTLAQVPVGLWIVSALPPDWQGRAMGGDVASVMMLGTSVMLAVFLLQDLAALALGEAQRKLQIRSMALMGLIVLLMTGVLERIKA